MKSNNTHTLEWGEFKNVVDKIQSLDEIEIIFKNLNNENIIIIENIQLLSSEIDKKIDIKYDLYNKKKIIKTNKKFEIKKNKDINKEINIDLYYNNMENIDNIIKLPADEFKLFIEKGNTLEENEDLSIAIIKEIEKCEISINEINHKIMDLSLEKDEKRKKWSYLYEYYRQLIKNEDDDKNTSTPIISEKIKTTKKKSDTEILNDNNIVNNNSNIDNIDNTNIENDIKEKKVIKKKTKKDIVSEEKQSEELNNVPVVKKTTKKKTKETNITEITDLKDISNNNLKEDVKEDIKNNDEKNDLKEDLKESNIIKKEPVKRISKKKS